MTLSNPPSGSARTNTWVLYAAAAVFVSAIPMSLYIGVYPVPFATVSRLAASLIVPLPRPASTGWTDTDRVVIELVRLPRILLAALAGTGLGLSGATLQGVLRNPLVGPDIVGISAGAACGAALAILLGGPEWEIVALAFLGGLLALAAATWLNSLRRARGVLSLVLAGVIVSSFFGALLSLFQFLARPDTQLPSLTYWLLGSFAGADAGKLWVLGAPVLMGGAALLFMRWRLNLLSLGEDDAATLGVNVARLRWAAVTLVALMVAAQVAVSGIVGWVGLLIPHIARMFVGGDHRRLLPLSALLGGAFMVLIDDLARSFPTAELPIGVLTAIVGTPIFAIVYWRAQGSGRTGE